MVDTRQAVENVRNLARTFQSVIDLAEALGQAESVEQALREANIRLIKLQGEVAAAEQAREDARAEGARTTATIKASIEAANANAAQILEAAKQDARHIVDSARAAAGDIAAKSKRESDDLRVELGKVCTARDAAQAELAELEAKIERARAKMRDILGA